MCELQSLADRDPLTGLFNHRAFYQALEAQHARSLRSGEPLAVLILDLDDFKAHNDRHGHLFGDETLRTVAQAILDSSRRGDIAARIGGDEFALALPNTTLPNVEIVAHRLITKLQETAGLSASVGVTTHPSQSGSFLDMVELAGNSLRTAKAAGKHRLQIA